jgi:hypothetical protein
MEELILTLAILGVILGAVGLFWSVRELVLSRDYAPPKRKRRSTYQALPKHRK